MGLVGLMGLMVSMGLMVTDLAFSVFSFVFSFVRQVPTPDSTGL